MEEKFEDGSYTAEVVLTGGSGRSGIQSPVDIDIKDGKITAEIIWSSPYYPVNSEGNSAFRIAVPAFDSDISLLAETVAMSEPHMIEYTIKFNSSTLKPTDDPTGYILYISTAALAAIVITAAFAVKRTRK